MAKIDGKTRVYGILGDPVAQTLSPLMYNALFEQTGVNAVYVAFQVKARDIGDALDGMRALGLQGVHLTCPHKESAIPHLDRLSQKAKAIGAVNVILNNRGMLYGDNTDGRGYLRSLQRELHFDPEGKTVALLGAGGSARAIAYTLAHVGARRFYILNRTPDRAERLAAEMLEHLPELQAIALPLEAHAFTEIAPQLDLVVNCTTPGPENTVAMLPADLLPSSCICSDINYFQPESPFITRAELSGLTVHRGLGMLVQQGALSLMLLTGLSVKPEVLESFIRARRGELPHGAEAH